MKNVLIGLVLVLALVHCTQCIFSDNYSYLDLVKYENGQSPVPYQDRVAMMPLLHWAHQQAWMRSYAASHESPVGRNHIYVETNSPEKVACEFAGGLSLFLILGALAVQGRRLWPEYWWMPPALTLGVFYVSYAARAGQNVWYPYDLPHAALFTLAALALLGGRWGVFLILFCLDVPMRETVIYLIPCALAVGYIDKQLGRAMAYSVAATVVWGVVTIAIHRHFRANPMEIGIRLGWMHHAVVDAQNWGQLASVFGFLWLPLVLCWKDLSRKQKAFLFGALPGVLFSALFGIWTETRLWCEWSGLVALMISSIVALKFQQREPSINHPVAEELSMSA